MSMIPKILLFTGKPGIGKTTLLKTIVNHLDANAVTGFYTSEIRIEGRRQGFQIEMMGTGQKGLLASPDIPGDIRFGTLLPDGRRRLGITLEFLEEVACPIIYSPHSDIKIVVIDEIGPMQISSPVFRNVLETLLLNKLTILASIADSDDSFISSIRNNESSALFIMNKSNRDILSSALSLYLSKELKIQYFTDRKQ